MNTNASERATRDYRDQQWCMSVPTFIQAKEETTYRIAGIPLLILILSLVQRAKNQPKHSLASFPFPGLGRHIYTRSLLGSTCGT